MIKQLLLVGTGGAIGSMLRYATSELTNKYYVGSFPLATFGINILGCLAIGALAGMIPSNSSLRFLLIIGFCGGFTTFSTFANETHTLMQSNQMLMALLYTLASCIVGVLAVWLGMWLTK